MADSSAFLRKAKDLRDKAAHEDDPAVRARLNRMADDYAHLAEEQAEKVAHPVDAAALGDVLTKGS